VHERVERRRLGKEPPREAEHRLGLGLTFPREGLLRDLHKGCGLLALEWLGSLAAAQDARQPAEPEPLARLEGEFGGGAKPLVERRQHGNRGAAGRGLRRTRGGAGRG
jgi:hypothetical protein